MSKAYRLFKQLLVAVIALAMLTSAWPIVAQSEKPPSNPQLKQFLEKRVQEPDRFRQLPIEYRSSPSFAAQGLPVWRTEVVDGDSIFGWGISLVLDQAEHPHISYGSPYGTTRYAYHNGMSWHIDTIDSSGTTGQETSIALDSYGRPHVSYKGNGNLKLASYDGATWHIEVVDSLGGDQGEFSSLALDSNNQPHISYYDNVNHDLKYARFDGSQWLIEFVDTSGDVGRYSNLRLDGLGRPHIVYCQYDPSPATCVGVKYTYKDSAGWHTQTVDGVGYASGMKLAIDANNQPHISYFDSITPDSYNADLKYASYNGSTWGFQTLDNSGPFKKGDATSLQLDRSGRPRLTYGSIGGMYSARYAYFDGMSWKLEDPPFGYGNGMPILYLDAGGRPHVAYYSNGIAYASRISDQADWSNLTFASYRDNNWEIYTSHPDQTNEARRTFNAAYDSMPDFNRGTNRIAFVSERDGNNEIYAMNADGANQTRLTSTTAYEYLPKWSPSGSKIAFYSYRDGNAEIYVVNADGANQTRLTLNSAWDGHPTWSPDGTKIAFASNRSGTDELWIMDADGSNQHQLTFGLNAAYPDWSPDGMRIAFSDDTNNDGWLELAIINADGTGLEHPFLFAPPNFDYTTPVWSPYGQDIAYARIQWVFYQGNYYWVDSFVHSINPTRGSEHQLTASGMDWWPDWQTNDNAAPSSRAETQSIWSTTLTFTVRWSGIEIGSSGIDAYDVQYREGTAGIWTDWLTNTHQAWSVFNGSYGHTYYFRSRARDYAGNLEAYPGGNGDTWTSVYQHTLSGQVLGNRDQPISVATIQANPSAMNTALSIHNGTFDLYFASGGAYDLTAARSGFGSLPPMLSFTVPNTSTIPIFYLPPIDDQLLDGQFESGSLIDWNPTGDVTATITTTVYSGDQAVQVGGPPPIGISNTWISAIEQTITVPPTLTLGTLSLVYQIVEADPVSDTLSVSLIGPTETLTYSLPLTSSGWTHQWWDVSTWTAPTATVRIEFTHGDYPGSSSAVFDDISWGSSDKGGEIVYLPVMYR